MPSVCHGQKIETEEPDMRQNPTRNDHGGLFARGNDIRTGERTRKEGQGATVGPDSPAGHQDARKWEKLYSARIWL